MKHSVSFWSTLQIKNYALGVSCQAMRSTQGDSYKPQAAFVPQALAQEKFPFFFPLILTKGHV